MKSPAALSALLCAAFICVRCDNPGSATDGTQVMTNPPNLAGTWNWGELVSEASSVCADEVGDHDTDVVTIAQTGSTLTLTGLIGIPTATLTGTIYPPQGTELARIKLSGNFSEDGGKTTVQEGSWIKVVGVDHLQGPEIWNWTGGGGSCTGVTDIDAWR
jgi:hypothetical protein